MLQNAYFLAKIGADTAENEQHFAEILPRLATTLRVRRALARHRLRRLRRPSAPLRRQEKEEPRRERDGQNGAAARGRFRPTHPLREKATI